MPARIPWDDYEIALLFDAYGQVVSGKSLKTVAIELSETLRRKALIQGKVIDGTYRNKNGMMMQLGNVQYIMTGGKCGLSGASASIKRMYRLMITEPEEFFKIREEARLMVESDNGKSTENISHAAVPVGEKAMTLAEKLTELIAEAFPRGIRPNSVIDRKKLMRLYSARFGTELDESLDLPQMITDLGVCIGDTVKVLSVDKKAEICELIGSIFNGGVGNIFYSELLNRHTEMWESLRVEDTDTLRKLLQAVCSEYRYSDNYFYKTGATYETDLLFAFGEDSVLSCAQVHDRLPYMEMSVIKLTLSRLRSFVWSAEGVFAKTDAVLLADEDVEYVLNTAIPEMNSKGYMSLNQLPLQASCELNPRLSFFAIRDAMYSRYIADFAERMRVIATPKGKTVSSYDLIRDWCNGKEQISIAELAEVEREITGTFHYLGGSYAASNMVRIDQDTFVSDKMISFDVTATDNAIALFVRSGLASLVQISSFTSFPDVQGYTWNLYLVESFLRRFSKRFVIDGGPAQTSYVGCISPAGTLYASYEDKLAEAVIQDGIPISESAIGRYLIENKYILRRSQSQIKAICNKALKLQEQRST